MYAVQSALAIKRAREKRASRSGPVAQIPADVKRELLKPPEQKGSLTYFNVGVAFTLLGKDMNMNFTFAPFGLGHDILRCDLNKCVYLN